MSNYGSIQAKTAKFGSAGDFVINDSGEADYPIGDPTYTEDEEFPNIGKTAYADTGTNISSTTRQANGFQLMNEWLHTFLLDTPPALTLSASTVDTEKVTVSWVNPTQREASFNDIMLPRITTIEADVVQSSLNGGDDWSDDSNTHLVLETVASGSPTVTELHLLVDSSGTSALNGTVYEVYGIDAEVGYDVRLYAMNESTKTAKTISAVDLATIAIGVPTEPLSVNATTASSTEVDTSWTIPSDREDVSDGTPYISRYRVTWATDSSVRYPNVIADSGESYTAETSGADATTSLAVTSLYPGTVHRFTVAARNALNTTYSVESTPEVTATTDYPTAPDYLDASACATLYDVATLRNPYSSSGGYHMDGTTVAPIILNLANLSSNDTRLVSATSIRSHVTEGTTDTTVGTVVAFGGLSTAYTNSDNQASKDIGGFGNDTSDGSIDSTSGNCRLVFSSDLDHYTGGATSEQGFYKSLDVYPQLLSVEASTEPYSLSLQYSPSGGSAVTTTAVEFYVDSLNAAPSVSDVGITSCTGITTISGVPTFYKDSTFNVQFNETGIGDYFLRNDKEHASISIETSGSKTISVVTTIDMTAIDGVTNFYYDTPTDTYNTSTTKHNTAGTELRTDPGVIQFNTFVLSLLPASVKTTYDEAIVVNVTPTNLYGAGSSTSGGYLNTTNNDRLQIRLDGKSVNDDKSAVSPSTIGQHVASGSGTYPSSGYGSAYDHSELLTTNEELQLVNGVFATYAYSGATTYQNYNTSTYYFAGLDGVDYSSIDDTGVRYVTFKFAPISSGSYERLRLDITHSDLSVDLSKVDAANHTCDILVTSSGSFGFETDGWMDCTNGVSGLGVQTGANGTTCLNSSTSSASQRDCFVLSNTTSDAIVYVRIGLTMNTDCSVTSVTCTPVEAF